MSNSPDFTLIPSVIPKGYEAVFKNQETELKNIEAVIKDHMKRNGYTEFYPEPRLLYSALEKCPLEKVRVVILGQDPYHQYCACGLHPRAQGCSFSVSECDTIPVSLNNIFTEIRSCDPNFVTPGHGNLSRWAEQGVLLLNTALTVQPNKAGSHSSVWFGFVEKCISAIVEKRPKCIFLLWGKEALKFSDRIPNSTEKLFAAHPSGFSARSGFFGCRHFAKVNEILTKRGEQVIDWNLHSIDT